MKYLTTRAIAIGLTATALVSGCGTDSGTGSSAGTEGSAISAQRCAKNKAAGPITYLSGYQFQASASILEYVAASRLGYFKDLCLDVSLKPGTGDTAQNTKLLASGQATISAISEQDVIQARAIGINITGISTYSNAGLDILMTNPDITALSQLNGKVVGNKGFMPASVRAMMAKQGVDYNSLKVVKVGYDPSVLPRRQGGLAAVTGFISNEPNLLKAAGKPVTVWQPIDYGIPSSLGGMAVNPAFAAAHPTAVADVLRAAIKAYGYCTQGAKEISECVEYAAKLSGPVFDTAHNKEIFTTEKDVIAAHPTPGQPLGGLDPSNVAALVNLLRQFDIIGSSVTAQAATSWFDNSFIAGIYRGSTLVWPAP